MSVAETEPDDKLIPDVPEDRHDLRILRSLRRIIRAADLYSKKLKSINRMTSPQLVCLLAVAEAGHLTVSQLAERVYLSPSTTVGILDRLESRRLIKRKRDLADRRVINISITEKGKEIAQSAPSPLQDNLARSLAGLPESEQAAISKALERIVSLMEVEHLDAAPILDTSGPDLANPENDPSPV